MKESLALLFMCSFAHANTLTCKSEFSDDFLYGTLFLKSKLFTESNQFKLSSIELDYKLAIDEELTDIWGEGYASEPDYTIINKKSYNPRVYKNHIKFESIYSRYIFGSLDLILPKNKLNKNNMNKAFTGFMIMTAMEDHWGSTIQLNCTLK